MDPQQELFTALLIALRAHFEPMGIEVFDGFLPPEGTKYPFIYLSDTRLADIESKSAILGNVYQHIQIWHNDPHKRGTVSQLLLDAKMVCRKLINTTNFAWSVQNIEGNVLNDTTTATPLLHGDLSVTFKFS